MKIRFISYTLQKEVLTAAKIKAFEWIMVHVLEHSNTKIAAVVQG